MKRKIALITGGYSSEAQISYKSVKTVYEHLDKEKNEVHIIDITPDGWFYTHSDGQKSLVDKSNFSIVTNGHLIRFDLAYLCLHGTPGEDGKLQGYFDLLGLPYTSCNAASSAITFNKRYTVAIAGMGGLNVAHSVHLFRQDAPAAATVLQRVKLPAFVKPNNGGSSLGMSKVNQPQEMEAALGKAFAEDEEVLVEEMIPGREFTIGVYRRGQHIHVLPITEVETHNEWFDFEAKYQGKSTETTPARIPETMAEKLQDAARKAYQLLNCRGVVRIDFIYNTEKDLPFLLEINTVPGQSEASIIPQQVRAAGMSLKQFYQELIEDSLAAQMND